MAFVGLPFLVNAAREAFAQLEPEYEHAALANGATPWQAFWHIALPQALGGGLTGALMMRARGVCEFGAVVILAYHPKVVPVLVYQRFEGFGLAAALPVAALLIVTALLVFLVVNLLARRTGAPTITRQAVLRSWGASAARSALPAGPQPTWPRRSTNRAQR